MDKYTGTYWGTIEESIPSSFRHNAHKARECTPIIAKQRIYTTLARRFSDVVKDTIYDVV